MIGFGAAYALALLGCTIGPFLAVVVSSFRSGSPAAGVGLFLTYAAGMGLVVGTAAMTLALARSTLVGRARRLAAVSNRAGGATIMPAGAYVAYYGWYELRVFDGGDPIIAAALHVQGGLSDGIDRLGTAALAAAFAAMVLIAVLAGRRGRRIRSRTPTTATAAPPRQAD